MEAGRELDALVAEKVMEQTDFEHGELGETSAGDPYCVRCKEVGVWGGHLFENTRCIKHYSTDIAAAWQVVEKLKEKWVSIKLIWNYEDQPGDGWYCSVGQSNQFIGYADTAPLAICLTALKVVGIPA